MTRTIADWGRDDGYFATADGRRAVLRRADGALPEPVRLVQLAGLVQRRACSTATGSPGRPTTGGGTRRPARSSRPTSAYQYPQASACFIQSVTDDMEGIMRLAHSEAMLFKFGSGTGTDLSTLRSSHEKLSGGGKPSGPVSFMRVYDAIASVVKSGGKTRRAAKMQTLKCWHPDILEFIECKTKEEKKAQALIRAGLRGQLQRRSLQLGDVPERQPLGPRAPTPSSAPPRTTSDWTTRAVTTGRPMETYKARMLLDKIAEGTWLCGDPGMQYEDTIQRWHTCPNTAPINSSNPCSEYMFIDDSACNLSSLNLMKFRREDGSFDAERFRAAVPDLHHGAGDPGRPRQLPDRADRAEQPQVPAAGAGLRQPRQPAHGRRACRTTRTRAGPWPRRSRRSCTARRT